MYAVEFQAKVKNGTIEIPSQYRNRLRDLVTVIVLAQDEEGNDFIDRLLETPLKMEGFEPLSRDETHGPS